MRKFYLLLSLLFSSGFAFGKTKENRGAFHTFNWVKSTEGVFNNLFSSAECDVYSPEDILNNPSFNRLFPKGNFSAKKNKSSSLPTSELFVPVINDAIQDIDENLANGMDVYTVDVTDPGVVPLTFSIIAGNESGAFAIGSDGTIKVADATQLDYEVLTEFILTVG